MNIYTPFYYFFYRWYRFNKVLAPNYNTDSFIIVGAISTFQVMNISSFTYIYEIYFGDGLLNKSYSTVLVILIIVINSLIFLTGGRDKKIIKKYSKETENQKRKSLLLTWLYLICTCVFLGYTVSLD